MWDGAKGNMRGVDEAGIRDIVFSRGFLFLLLLLEVQDTYVGRGMPPE